MPSLMPSLLPSLMPPAPALCFGWVPLSHRGVAWPGRLIEPRIWPCSTFYTFSNFVIINLFITAILENFDKANEDFDKAWIEPPPHLPCIPTMHPSCTPSCTHHAHYNAYHHAHHHAPIMHPSCTPRGVWCALTYTCAHFSPHPRPVSALIMLCISTSPIITSPSPC